MAYFLDLFSPETYEAFGRSDHTISGFRPRQQGVAQRVRKGDRLLCYMTRLSRWFGVLEVIDGPFNDDTPIFYDQNDPFVIRFHVQSIVWLPVEKAIPIHEDLVWKKLSFTRTHSKSSTAWTGKIRASLVELDEADGEYLEELIRKQAVDGQVFPLDESQQRKYMTHRVRRADKDVTVSVPEEVDAEATERPAAQEVRESLRIQALLAEIGARMGAQIWIPRADRPGVLAEWKGDHPPLLERLPLNYDDTTLRTIEQIDVLWLRGRAIQRAFEVEHTTSVYSGILRMADLLALQPNMNIRLHIVAPTNRRNKVFQEVRRPVFSLLDRGPLSETCTYLSYESVRELAEHEHLAHLADSVLGEYEEDADD